MSLGLFLIYSKLGGLVRRGSGSPEPVIPTDVTAEEYWNTNPGEFGYKWNDELNIWLKDSPNTSFGVTTNFFPAAGDAEPGEEWYNGLRPTKTTILFNSGDDEGTNGELDFTVDILRTGSEYIVQPVTVEFDNWNEDKEVELVFDWSGVTTQNIQSMRISSNLKNQGPIIKSMVLSYD